VRRKNAVLEAALREDRGKLENQIRHSGDSQLMGVQELATKFNFMEDKIQADEQERSELRRKLQAQEETNRALSGLLQNLKLQGDSELGQMRQYLQEKLNEDHVSNVKNKEKNNVLFSEVVRIGEINEKHQEILSNMQVVMESRI